MGCDGVENRVGEKVVVGRGVEEVGCFSWAHQAAHASAEPLRIGMAENVGCGCFLTVSPVVTY